MVADQVIVSQNKTKIIQNVNFIYFCMDVGAND